MTKKEFKEMEAICKRAWRYLARTGNLQKPQYLNKFFQQCPACEVADGPCSNCPVTKWRVLPKNLGSHIGKCAYVGQEFYNWAHADCTADRKAAALAISKLEWSWMSKYKNVVLK